MMSEKNIVENIKGYGMNKLFEYLDSNPDKNIPKILDWVDKFDKKGIISRHSKVIRNVLKDDSNHWNKYIKSLWTDIDDEVRKTIFKNFIVNSAILGMEKQEKISKKNDCNVPWAILMDPTSACNLKCIGCWAAEYGHKLNMSFETLDEIVRQGKEMGTYMYIFSGGEPLIRKKDIIKLCEKNNDCAFLSFTNGTLIDEEFADEMLRVKNFVPAISIEGYEEDTDFRRGNGTYNAVINAMEILKRKKLPFGISCCYTSKNYETIGSEEYFDDMIEKGAKFAWFFTYMPIGADAVTDLMVTADQRKHMYYQIRNFRKTKAIFTLDFWNDGEYVNGCIAGGRRYLHINANGDIEPCAFIHYSDSNIKDKSLLEAYKSPLFMNYRKGQPFNSNHLRPCPLLDNPDKIVKIVRGSRAVSTDMQEPEDVGVLSGKCLEKAEKWSKAADELWKDHRKNGRKGA